MSRNGKNNKGGRPKGSLAPKTLEKMKVLTELRQRIMKSTNSIFNAAKSAAVGNQLLYALPI
jgi:hypothetical protein